jgi:hypothetical protein
MKTSLSLQLSGFVMWLLVVSFIPETLFPVEKELRHEAAVSLQLVLRSRMVELYFHSPILLHGMAHN